MAAGPPGTKGGSSGDSPTSKGADPAGAFSISFPVQLASSSRPVCLESWARRAQLAIRWAAGQQWAKVSGSVTNIGRAFDVEIEEHRGPDGRCTFATNQTPTNPSNVCGEVKGSGVIHSYQRPTDYDVPGGGLLSQQLLQAYDAQPLASEGLKGQGETIVLFESDGFSTADLRSFVKLLWEELSETLRNSNRDQAADIVSKLRAISCDIAPAENGRVSVEFSSEEIERLAELEHERWEAERRLDGWTLGPTKDPVAKRSPYLVPWEDLSQEVRRSGPRHRTSNSPLSRRSRPLCRSLQRRHINQPRLLDNLVALRR